MRRVLTVIVIGFAGFLSLGCSHFDDMNKNPYAIYDATPESYVQTILYQTEYKMMQKSYDLITQLMQQTVTTDYSASSMLPYNYVINESNASALWSLYTQKGNAESMLVAARKKNDPGLEGVALVLRAMVMQIITDTYGDVPYFNAGLIPLQGSDLDFTIEYDSQKDIYIDMFKSLEKANKLFQDERCKNFNAICDYTYGGDIVKWRKFGNSLYLRLLMRASLKAMEESEGVFYLGEEYGSINVKSKIAQIYDDFGSDSGDYPIFNSIDDRARVMFSDKNSAFYTPFYTTTSGIFKTIGACATLVDEMVIKDVAGKTTHVDPRYYFFFTRPLGLPAQLSRSDVEAFLDSHVTSLGNSQVGRYANGGEYGELKNGEYYSLMNYSELLFIFAEAGCREWLPLGSKDVKQMYLDACAASMEEWNPYDIGPDDVTSREDYIALLNEGYDYDKALEEIMLQKWIATFWVGVENWADYRRTGYPILKTNGPAAENNNILCTRMRYPATEVYQNKDNYQAAVDAWLGGQDDMLTDMWWADTQESKSIRRKGRQ